MKDFWAEELQNRKKNRVFKIIILVIIALLIIGIGICIWEYYINLNFRSWCDENILRKEILQENTKSIELEGDENTKVFSYEKYICVFRKKTLEFYNKIGTQTEKMELDINEAVSTTAGRYMAICEENGQKFYLICGKEKLFEREIEGNIKLIFWPGQTLKVFGGYSIGNDISLANPHNEDEKVYKFGSSLFFGGSANFHF